MNVVLNAPRSAVRLKTTREPIWTTNEVERFWEILEPYLRQLVSGEIPTQLDHIDFFENTSCQKKLCYQIVHTNMWNGKYSSAVATLKAFQKYNQVSREDDSRNNEHEVVDHESNSVRSDLEELKKIFTRRPLNK